MKENTVKFDYWEFDEYFIHTESPADIIPKLEALRISYLELCLDQAQLDFSGDARYSHDIEWAITHSWLLQDFIKLLKSLHSDEASHSVDIKSDAIEQKAASLEKLYLEYRDKYRDANLRTIKAQEEGLASIRDFNALSDKYEALISENNDLKNQINSLNTLNCPSKENN